MPPAKKRPTKKRPASTTHRSGLVVRNADLDRARPFRWAWKERVLIGYLNLQIGEEGVGKGNLTAWQAARLSRGELPGDLHGAPSRVAFLGDEDAWDHIWGPRFAAAGADLKKIVTIENAFDVFKDAEALRELIEDTGVALVYFDQLLDNLGASTDHWKDKDVREALHPLRRIAQETDVALLASMHPNKRGGSFRERISGTAAFNALSRSSLLVARHPQDEGRVAVVRGKGNYGPEPQAFEFRIEEHLIPRDDFTIVTSRIIDIRETDLRRDDLLEPPAKKRAASERDKARALLGELFKDGQPRPAGATLEEMEVGGFSKRTVQDAKNDLGLVHWTEGFQGTKWWGFEKPPTPPERKRRTQ